MKKYNIVTNYKQENDKIIWVSEILCKCKNSYALISEYYEIFFINPKLLKVVDFCK